MLRVLVSCFVMVYSVAHAAEVRGRVFDAVTFVGLEGASVTLDLLPADGTPEYTTSTDVFGMYSITNIPAGSYRLKATHPGYTTAQQDEVIAVDAKLAKNFPLVRLVGDPTRFKIVTEVSCVKSGLRLGNVKVLVERFAGAGDVTPDTNYTLITDSNGRAILHGAIDGHYVFTVNHPVSGSPRARWESFVSPRKALHGPHLTLALLKPVPQTMTVNVKGFDPTLGMAGMSNQPLRNIYVEFEGLDPADTNSVLIPTRTGVTDANGNAEFTDLPAIAWRATAKRFGYVPATATVFPNSIDTLPTTNNLTLNPMPIPFGLMIDSEYLNPLMMTGLTMRVTGITNSNTEGITRITPTFLFDPPGPPPPFVGAGAPGLIAGRYEVSITGLVTSAAIKSGAHTTTGRFDVVFSGNQVLDVYPGFPVPSAMVVNPELATVRVRYHKADAMSTVEVADAAGVITNRPAYARAPVDLLVFKESAVSFQLKPPFRMTMFGTDESGEAVIKILPGVYGLEAPTLSEYFGSDCRIHDATTGETLSHGWPFMNSPDAAPFPMSPHHSLGLRFSSGHEYQVDLYTRAKFYDVRGEVKPDPLDPVTQRIVAVSGTNSVVVPITELTSGGVATLAGHPPTKPLTLVPQTITNANPAAPNAEFLFEDVPPGTRSLSITHPRNAITPFSGGSSLSVALPDWGPPGIVDASDVADAAAGLFPLQTRRLQNGGGGPAFTAAMPIATDTVKVNHYRWITNAPGSYVLETGDILNPNYFVPDHSPASLLYRYAGAGRFKMGSRDWFLYFVLNPTNWFKAGFITTNTGHEFVFNAYSGGPSNNVIGPITEVIDLSVRAESDADASLSIPFVRVEMQDGTDVDTPYITNSYSASYVPMTVGHSNWAWTTKYTFTEPLPGEFLLTLKMRRGMGVSGLVRDANNSAPLANARVQVLDRFGGLLNATNTATNGTFIFPALLTVQPVFLDITVPGYVQHRLRHTPTVTALDFICTNNLVALKQPVILTNELDRFGMFLPRVRKAGNTGNYTDFNASDALTMTWRLLANEHTFALDIPEFDLPGGGTRSSFSMITDPIEETWLVDARGFAGNPYSSTWTNLTLPPATNATAIRMWLAGVRSGAFSNVFARRVAGRMPEPLPGTNVEVRATQLLWELPNGTFRPVFVALTKRGSAAINELNYTGAETNKTLFGEPMPSWLAFTADLFGYVAGFQAATGVEVTDEHVEQFMPAGRFKALPEFTADIAEENGFLNYDYGLGISWKEGQDTPRSGFLQLAPKLMGLEFGAALEFGLAGEERKFSLAASASLSCATNLDYLVPKGLSFIEEPSGGFTVVAGTSISQAYTNSSLALMEIKNHVGGSLSGSVKVNVRPITSKIPYVGPALLALDQSKAAQLFFTINGGIGLEVQNRWRTEYPMSQANSGSIDPTEKLNYRRHFLGGIEDIGITTGENSLDLCFRFGVGAELSLAGGRASATIDLALQGNPCGGMDSLKITPTTNSFGLPVVKVTGALNLTAAVSVDLGAASFGTELINVDLLPIDVQFGTESSFYFVEMSEIPSALLVSTAPAAAFVPGNGPDKVRNFYRAGATAASGAGNGLTYTDIDPTNELMVIRLTGTDCLGDEPVTVASAPAILSVATTRLPSGQWLTAWSEIAAADVGSPYSSSTIKYSLSGTNCTNWTAAAVVPVLPNQATDLYFVTSGLLTGLVWLHTAEGPLSLQRGVSGATWNGSSWSAATELVSTRDIAGFDAIGIGGGAILPAVLAWSDATGALRSLTWNGTTTTGPHTIGTNGLGVLALDVNPDGQFHCAWNSTDGGIKLSRFDGVSSWTLLGTPVSGINASELQLAPHEIGGANAWLLAWIDATDTKSQNYAFANTAGVTIKASAQVAFPDGGRYSRLHVQPQAGLGVRLIARHTGTNNVTNIREYLATPAGIAPWLLNTAPTGGGLQFELVASPNQSYRLQGSSNLVNWVDLQSFTATNSPVVLQNNTGVPHRFYRAVTP